MSALQPLHLSWKIIAAFLMGYQWLEVDRIQRTLHVVPPKQGDVRAVENQMLPIYVTGLAKLLLTLPEFGVRPGSDQQIDLEAAELGKVALRSIWEGALNGEDRCAEAFGWMRTCGTGFLNLGWNPKLGRTMKEWKVNGEIRTESSLKADYGDFTEEDGIIDGAYWEQPTATKDMGWERIELQEGEHELTAISPFCVYPDPMATHLDNARWVIIVKALSIDELVEHYGSKAKGIQPETSELYASPNEKEFMDLFMSSLNVNAEGQKKQEGTEPQYILVKQMQMRPNRAKGEKKGRIVTIAGDRMLDNIENPFDYGDFTLFMMREIPMPGQFWGRAIAEQQIPIQTLLNQEISQVAENHRKFAKYDWLIPKGSRMAKPSNRPSSHYYTPYGGVEPKVIVPPSLPASIFQEIASHRAQLVNVGMIHEVTLEARPPGGVTSGIGISNLQEQDEMRMTPTTREINGALLKVAKAVLINTRDFYKEPRMLKEFSEDRITKVRSFKGEDLGKDFDVIIEQRDAFPRSPTAKRQTILAYYQMGILGPQQDRRTTRHVRRLLQLGDEPIGFSVDEISEEEALSENRMLESDEMPEVNMYQDDAIHIEMHRVFILGGKFKSLPPKIQQNTMAHVKAHGDKLTMMYGPTIQEQAAQQMMGGMAGAGQQQNPGGGPTQAPPGQEEVPEF